MLKPTIQKERNIQDRTGKAKTSPGILYHYVTYAKLSGVVVISYAQTLILVILIFVNLFGVFNFTRNESSRVRPSLDTR